MRSGLRGRGWRCYCGEWPCLTGTTLPCWRLFCATCAPATPPPSHLRGWQTSCGALWSFAETARHRVRSRRRGLSPRPPSAEDRLGPCSRLLAGPDRTLKGPTGWGASNSALSVGSYKLLTLPYMAWARQSSLRCTPSSLTSALARRAQPGVLDHTRHGPRRCTGPFTALDHTRHWTIRGTGPRRGHPGALPGCDRTIHAMGHSQDVALWAQFEPISVSSEPNSVSSGPITPSLQCVCSI